MEILPQGAWFGLTKRRLRKLFVAVLAIIIALFLTWLSLFAYINWKAHRLTRLESELHKLHANQDATEAKRIEAEFSDLMEYVSCTGRECRIYLRADWYLPLEFIGHGEKLDRIIQKLAELLDNTALNRIGIRMWYAK